MQYEDSNPGEEDQDKTPKQPMPTEGVGQPVDQPSSGVTPDKSASTKGAGKGLNGHDDGGKLNGAHKPASVCEADAAPPVEGVKDEAEAHEEKSGLGVPEKYDELIMFLYDELKVNVVPNNPEKKCPAVKWKELQERRVEEEELARWHKQGRFKGGIGFLTGPISNAVVIDSDGTPGEDVLAEWAAQFGPLPKTLTSKSSGGRGLHRFYRHPGGYVKTKANTSIKLDIKGDKGYVALCRNGNPWKVVSDTLEIAELPEGLLEFIAAKAEAAKEKKREGLAKEVKREFKQYPVRETDLSPLELKQYKAYATSAIEGEADKLAATQKNVESRNDTLFVAVCKLGQYIHHGIVDVEDVKAALNNAWLKTRTAEELEDEYQKSLDEEEFIDTFNSGLKRSKDAPLRDIYAKPELTPDEKLKKILNWARRGIRSDEEIKGLLLALARSQYQDIEQLAKSWLDNLPKKKKPKEDFDALWKWAQAEPEMEGNPTVETWLAWAKVEEARATGEINRCASMSTADYKLERHQVAADLGYDNVTDFDEVVKERKREIKRGEKGDGATQTDNLVGLAESNIELLFHTPDGKAYADIDINGTGGKAGRKTLAIGSRAFKSWLEGLLKRLTRRSYEEKVIKNVINDLRVTAEQEGPKHEVYKRYANSANARWIDIGDATYRAIKVTKEGWEIVARPELRFERTSITAALPIPHPTDGTIDDLQEFIGLKGDDFLLTVAWLSFCAQLRETYPIIGAYGEANSGKTWLIKHLGMLLDPQAGKHGITALPKKIDDIYVLATSRFALAFDNVSNVKGDISDVLCMIATGSAYPKRKNYEDAELISLEACATIIINGCEELLSRQDLVSRSIFLKLTSIPVEARVDDEEVKVLSNVLAPKAYRALLDLIVKGLNRITGTARGRATRIQAFEVWGEAIEEELGFSKGTFQAALHANQKEALIHSVSGDRIGAAIRELMKAKRRDVLNFSR